MESKQDLLNIALGLVSALGGFYMKVMWDSIKTLTDDNQKLCDKVSSIEVLVAGQYVKRDYLDGIAKAMFDKLDKISDKLDKKADK